MQESTMAGEIVNRVVQSKAVIPENQVSLLPAMSEGKLGSSHVPIEKIEQRPRFRFGHTVEAFDEHPVDVETASSGRRMGAHHRVDSGFGGVIGCIRTVIAVYRVELLEKGLQARAQGFEACDTAGKTGVATQRRQNPRMQAGQVTRRFAKGDVGVPVAPAEQACAVRKY